MADNAHELHNKSAQYIRKITWIGLVVNVLLSTVKFVAGYLGTSQTLIADAIHSLSDSITDIGIIIGSFFWAKPPDTCHPHGHQRIETFITILLGMIILVVGISIGWHAIVIMHEKHFSHPTWIAWWAALLSIVCKEILFRWTTTAGKKVHSTALSANAWHHRLDALSSIPALLAIHGAILFPHWTFIDSLGAIIVSIFIIQAAGKILLPRLQELLEKGASKEVLEQIKNTIYQHPKVIQIHKLRTRYLGLNLLLDFHLVVTGNITVKQGHDIAEEVKSMLLEKLPDLNDVTIHIEPDEMILI